LDSSNPKEKIVGVGFIRPEKEAGVINHAPTNRALHLKEILLDGVRKKAILKKSLGSAK